MREPTVFSQTRSIKFDSPVARNVVEEHLKTSLANIGTQLAFENVIIGHIKLVCRLPEEGGVLFMSLTMLDQVDVQALPGWQHADGFGIINMEIVINVLIFGHSLDGVKKTVDSSFELLLQEIPD